MNVRKKESEELLQKQQKLINEITALVCDNKHFFQYRTDDVFASYCHLVGKILDCHTKNIYWNRFQELIKETDADSDLKKFNFGIEANIIFLEKMHILFKNTLPPEIPDFKSAAAQDHSTSKSTPNNTPDKPTHQADSKTFSPQSALEKSVVEHRYLLESNPVEFAKKVTKYSPEAISLLKKFIPNLDQILEKNLKFQLLANEQVIHQLLTASGNLTHFHSNSISFWGKSAASVQNHSANTPSGEQYSQPQSLRK